MSSLQTPLRILVTIALILLPLILVVLTSEPLERTPSRQRSDSAGQVVPATDLVPPAPMVTP